MKHLPIFLIIIVSCLLGCSKSEQTNSCDMEDEAFESIYNTFPKGFEMFDRGDNICFINYRNKIHGYDVRIGVRQFIYIDSTLIGNAEIAFLRNDTLFLSLPNPFFRIDGLNSKNIANHDIVELDYTFPDINKLKPIEFSQFNNLPFFFLDVNFDGNDELIMNYARQGQRTIDAYVVYGLQYWHGDIGYDFLYDATRGVEPFANLDEFSDIDYTQKEISTFAYGGYSDSKRRIYKSINGGLHLDRIEDYDSLGWLLARRRILKIDTITTYHNGREYLYK